MCVLTILETRFLSIHYGWFFHKTFSVVTFCIDNLFTLWDQKSIRVIGFLNVHRPLRSFLFGDGRQVGFSPGRLGELFTPRCIQCQEGGKLVR